MLLAYDLVGSASAPPLVLVHGITESRRSWAPLLGQLGEEHHVLSVDLRGHGESPVAGPYVPISYASDVVETMKSVGIDRADVIGHSLGGVVASAVAALGAARRVINVDQPLRLASFKAGLTQLEPMLRGNAETFAAAIAMLFASMAGPLPSSEVERLSALRKGNPDVVLGTWASVFESTPEELDAAVAQLAGAITVPYLSLHGIDPGDEYATWLHGLVPTAVVEVWADHGHYPHLVDAPRFCDRVRRFLAD